MNRLGLFVAIVTVVALTTSGFIAYDRLKRQSALDEKSRAPAATEAAVSDEQAGEPSPSDQAERETSPTLPAEQQQALSSETASEGQQDQSPQGPTFDIVRVERTGEAVIAGRASPKARIFIENNGTVIAETVADADGQFVAIPLDPFKGEANEVVIREQTAGGDEALSGQIVAIAIPSEGTPLVVVVEAGKAAEVLQKPELPVFAAAETEAVLEKKTPGVDNDTVDQARVVREDKADRERAPSVSDQSPQTTAAPENDEAELETAGASDANDGAPTDTSQTTTRVARLTPESGSESRTDQSQKNESAASTPALSTLSVDAVEVENDRIFIAGASKPNQVVRVYVDDESLGDAKASPSGRWLYEDTRALEPGKYDIRADQVKSETGEVQERAEVPFVVEDRPANGVLTLGGEGGRKVIIRRNDNLWTISQRLYGDGNRFTAIYANNRGQIRNPDLIYPGQVFELPDDGLQPVQGPGASKQ